MDIADYGLLSDCNTAALVGRDATIDWYCPGRIDAPSVFARLLGPDAGHWTLQPAGDGDADRAYIDGTLVLRTSFTTPSGSIEILDALALTSTDQPHHIGRSVPHVLIRLVRGRSGTVRMTSELVARFDYGMTAPRIERHDDGAVTMRRGPRTLRLRSDADLHVTDHGVTAAFDVSDGAEVGFTLADAPTFGNQPPTDLDAATAISDTIAVWQSWMDLHQGYDGRHRDQVRHSALVLQGLTYQPSGAVVAAATTSLPEQIGGDANYDYRFTWLRDLSMTLQAQWVAACPDEASRYFRWLTTATGRLDDAEPQIMYGIEGERLLTEETLEHLPGYADSRPVRVGNAAWKQRQLDVMGEILNAAHLLRDQLQPLDEDTRAMLVNLADQAAARWNQPDAGMWEARDRHRHYLTSKVLCWVALDRAVRLSELLDAADRVQRWTDTRDEIHRTVRERGWSEHVGAYTGAFGSNHLDASVLLMPIVGFLDATDPRMRATIDRIERTLADGGALRRWKGEPGGFLLTAFWLVECLALAGDLDQAETWFDRAASHANNLGLFSEEIEPDTGRLTGNFPQAFSHVGLINAAWRLTRQARHDSADGEPEPPS
ncbi:MAG: glycoside hydrolase family 15 protein [Actinobacteria bacterium]|nr:glycoside hydrolase family 15 protein [Actinomycetota bacterium]